MALSKEQKNNDDELEISSVEEMEIDVEHIDEEELDKSAKDLEILLEKLKSQNSKSSSPPQQTEQTELANDFVDKVAPDSHHTPINNTEYGSLCLLVDKAASIIVINNHKNEKNEYSWQNSDYLDHLINLPNYEEIEISNENINTVTAEKLQLGEIVDKYEHYVIKTNILYEKDEYLYEIVYVYIEGKNGENDINSIACMLNNNGDIIYYNALIIKTKIEISPYKIVLTNIYKDDIKHILNQRVKIELITYNDGQLSETFAIDTKHFITSFFNDEQYITREFKILKYNITIHYIENEYEDKPLPYLLNKGMEKAIIMLKITDDIYNDLSLEELRKLMVVLKEGYQNVPPTYKEGKKVNGIKRIYTRKIILDDIYNSLIC